MTKRKIRNCVLSLMLLLSCNVKQTKVEGNRLLIRADENNDSIKYQIRYYNNGLVEDSVRLLNGKYDGWEFQFGEDSKKIAQIYYINGKRTGWTVLYDKKGNISDEQLYINDKKFGSGLSYYENGEPNTYNCYDFEENNRRVKIYNKDGRVMKDEGKIITQAQVYGHNFTFKRGQDVLIDIGISTPPNEKVNVWVYEQANIRERKEYKINDNNIVTFQEKNYKPGKYKLITIARSVDTVTSKIYNDSSQTIFKVE